MLSDYSEDQYDLQDERSNPALYFDVKCKKETIKYPSDSKGLVNLGIVLQSLLRHAFCQKISHGSCSFMLSVRLQLVDSESISAPPTFCGENAANMLS